MKRITLVLGVVAVMAAMLVALAAPAMAKDNDGRKGGDINRQDNRFERLDHRLDNRVDRLDLDDGGFLVSDVDFSPVFATDEGLADELCSPLNSDAIDNAIPGCIFGLDEADGFAVDNESESGSVDLDFSVTNTGDYASQCVPATQFGNSGNFNNAPSFAQFGSGGFVDDDHNDDFGFFNHGGIDDFEPGGIDFSVSPEVAVDCSNTIQQSSAADSSWWY